MLLVSPAHQENVHNLLLNKQSRFIPAQVTFDFPNLAVEDRDEHTRLLPLGNAQNLGKIWQTPQMTRRPQSRVSH